MAALKRGVWTAECQVEARRGRIRAYRAHLRVAREGLARSWADNEGRRPYGAHQTGRWRLVDPEDWRSPAVPPRMSACTRMTRREIASQQTNTRFVWRRIGLDGKVLLLWRVNHTDGSQSVTVTGQNDKSKSWVWNSFIVLVLVNVALYTTNIVGSMMNCLLYSSFPSCFGLEHLYPISYFCLF